MNNYLALLGWSPKDDREVFTMQEMIDAFDLPGVNQSNSRFDYKKCVWVNGEHLRALTPSAFAEAAAPFLEKANLPTDDERLPAALDLVRERAQLLTEVPEWIGVIFADDITVATEATEKVRNKEGAGKALEAMSATFSAVEDWNDDNIKAAIHQAADGLGVKMGALMLPCRVAASGSLTGVDLIALLRLTGKPKVIARLDSFRGSL